MVAIKELKSLSEKGYSQKDAWEREADALKEISSNDSRHLIRPLAAFSQRSKYYIVCEWADGGTLRNVWEAKREIHQNLGGEYIMAFLEQILGVMKALSCLHSTNKKTKTALGNGGIEDGRLGKTLAVPNPANLQRRRLESGSNSEGGKSSDPVDHWRHGDLKPDNILVFNDAKGKGLGVWKIADLGLAKQHAYETTLRNLPTNTRHTTLHYEAPEASTSQEPRSRRYDNWSMGCIIFESVIWLLYGGGALKAFFDRHIQHADDTLYFTVTPGVTKSAKVSELVRDLLEAILKDPECTRAEGTVIADLLKLVRDELLVVALSGKSVRQRADAGTVVVELERIWAKASCDKEYLFTGTRRADVALPSELRSTASHNGSKASKRRDSEDSGVAWLSNSPDGRHKLVSLEGDGMCGVNWC